MSTGPICIVPSRDTLSISEVAAEIYPFMYNVQQRTTLKIVIVFISYYISECTFYTLVISYILFTWNYGMLQSSFLRFLPQFTFIFLGKFTFISFYDCKLHANFIKLLPKEHESFMLYIDVWKTRFEKRNRDRLFSNETEIRQVIETEW